MPFRHGQWVRFTAAIEGAHTTADGKVVGIFQHAREGSPVTLGVNLGEGPPGSADVTITPVPTGHPAHVAVVRPDGTNLMRLGDDGQSVVKVAIDPAELPELEAATVPDDLPESRRPGAEPTPPPAAE